MFLRALVYIGLFIFQITVFGQSKLNTEHLIVYVNELDQSVKATVLSSKNFKINPDKNKTYFWYSNNQIIQTNGGVDGKLLDGEYSSFYLNNNLKQKGKLKKGLRVGEWRSWYENGKLKEITEWNKGVKDGNYEAFNEKGDKIFSACYSNDKLNGKEIKYNSGKIISLKKYKNGIEIIPIPEKEKKTKRADGDSVKGKSKKESIQKENSSNIEQQKTVTDSSATRVKIPKEKKESSKKSEPKGKKLGPEIKN